MKNISHISICFIVLSIFCSYKASAQFKVEDVLKKISAQYDITQKNRTAISLIILDSMLRAFVDSTKINYEYGGAKYWKEEYSKLGLEIGHYSENFQYSEKFLYDAYLIDSNSTYGSYTHYAPIVGVGLADRLGWFPNVNASLRYVQAYPNGHFIYDVYIILADFYTDLYMALRDGKEKADYHYDCLESYIDKTPISEQLSRAQKQSIYYYEQALKIRPNESNIKERIIEVKNGTVDGWSTCSD